MQDSVMQDLVMQDFVMQDSVMQDSGPASSRSLLQNPAVTDVAAAVSSGLFRGDLAALLHSHQNTFT